MIIRIWQVPRDDFDALNDFCGYGFADWRAYTDTLAAVQADQERHGRTVERVVLSVDEMRERLAAAGLDNTQENRAAIVAMEKK